MEWMLLPFRRYAEFSGRSRRLEYWMFALLNVIVSAIAYLLMLAGGAALVAAPYPPEPELFGEAGLLFWLGAILLLLWILVALIPSIAVTVRRLHDINLTGWIYLAFVVLSFVPIVSFLALIGFLVLMAWPGTKGANKYGPDPRAREGAV